MLRVDPETTDEGEVGLEPLGECSTPPTEETERRVEEWVSAYLDGQEDAAAGDRLELCLEGLTGGGRGVARGRTGASQKVVRVDWNRFRVWRRRGIVLVRLSDSDLVREDRVEELAADLMDLIGAGNYRVVLDLSEVERMASWVVGVVAEMRRRCEAEAGGGLKLCGVRPAVGELFKISGLARGLDLAAGAGEAMAGPWPVADAPRALPVEVLAAVGVERGWESAGKEREGQGERPELLRFEGRGEAMAGVWLMEEGGEAVEVVGRRFEIGRDPGCALRPMAATVSRRHAAIEIREEGIWLVDLGSVNGTGVNGRCLRAEEARLEEGDRVEIGPLRFTVRIGGVSLTPENVDELVVGWIAGEEEMEMSTVEVETQVEEGEEERWPGVRCRVAGETWVVRPAGPDLEDEEAVDALRDALTKLVQRGGPRRMVINLEFVGRLSGTAIGVLVAHHLRLLREGGSLRICQAHPRVRAMLESLRLTQLVEYHDTLDQAVLEPWADRPGSARADGV